MRDWQDTFARNLRIFRPEKLSDWCEAHFTIADGASPEAGLFRCDRTPYIRKILDACTDPMIREVVVCAGVQVGKTTAALALATYHMIHDPAPVIFVEPSQSLAEDIGKDRLKPQIMQTDELRALFGVDAGLRKNVESPITKTRFIYPAGHLLLASAASQTDLISRSFRVAICDEIDQYPPRCDGKAVDLAIGRTTTFYDSKVLMVSTPSTLFTSEIWRRLNDEKTTRYAFKVPCQHCQLPNEWTWEMVKWDEGAPETARMECPHCGGIIRGGGAAPDWLLARGAWCLEHEGSPSRVGFHLSGLLSPWKPLSEMAAEFYRATTMRDMDSLRAFIQNRLAQPWDDQRHNDVGDAVLGEFEDDLTWDTSEIEQVTAGFDVQDDRIEGFWFGWDSMENCWLLRQRAIVGSPLIQETWDRVLDELREPVETSDGRVLKLRAAFIDSGGHGGNTRAVYAFTKGLEKHRVFAIKGAGGEGRPVCAAPSRNNALRAPLIIVGTHAAKLTLTERLLNTAPGRTGGRVHLPLWAQGEIWRQLTAERRIEQVVSGKRRVAWVKVRERNEALDCFVYAYAAFIGYGLTKRRKS